MSLKPFEKVLVQGGRTDLIQFGNCKICVVVDWRDDLEAILNAVAEKLPNGYLQFQRMEDHRYQVQCRGDVHFLVHTPESDMEPVLQAINRVLLPEYEMLILQATMGDGYSLLLRPVKWWKEFENTYPGRVKKVFVSIDERVEQTGTGRTVAAGQSRTWWSKLFGSNK